MGKRYTKFKSNYLMRSDHQRTESGHIMERDWVTTNGLNPLRFGSGRRIFYNSGNFVFTTSNIPSYHKKHNLSTEVKEWVWNDVANADGTSNTIQPSFNSNDIRSYAYYGSCVELIRATVEEIITDFPGNLVSTQERIVSLNNREVTDVINKPSYTPYNLEVSVEYYSNPNECYIYDNTSQMWVGPLTHISNENTDLINGNVGDILYDVQNNSVKIIKTNGSGRKYFDEYGIHTDRFNRIYYFDNKYFKYNYVSKSFEEYTVTPNDTIIDGFLLRNQFNIDLHHQLTHIGTYENPMRFLSQSWGNYCVVEGDYMDKPYMVVSTEFIKTDENGNETPFRYGSVIPYDEYEKLTSEEKSNLQQLNSIISYTIKDGFNDKDCPSNNYGKIVKEIEITTWERKYKILVYNIANEIVYVYKPINGKQIKIQPTKSYIDNYFQTLNGFKRQLLRQDTKPYYSNKFITPLEHNFRWVYPERVYTWPSDGYCIDISSESFSNFVNSIYDMAQKMDELWSDNIYRSMTHEAIKNFDWTYSKEYYEDEAQDNIDGGERMSKVLRVMGRVFDDVKHYIDTIKNINNITYDKINNLPEALISDANELKGLDAISTISGVYDIDTSITEGFYTKFKKDSWWVDNDANIKRFSKLPKWFAKLHSDDMYPDVCDNEMMRRMALSIKQMMRTKGTQEGIEMMMGVFGLGRGIDYEIEENAYYTEKLIPSDECIDGKLDDNNTHQGEDWSKTSGVDWSTIDTNKKGSLASEINVNKELDILYYSDPLSGIPMRNVILGRDYTTINAIGEKELHLGEQYLVPYYDNSQIYDGDLYFQGRGGWAKSVHTDDTDIYNDIFEYQETLSYLHVANTISDMLSVNPNTVDANTIYYITNLSDYASYDENPPISIGNNVTMSHFFILVNYYNPHKLSSWRNIVVKPKLDKNGKLQQVDKQDFETVFAKTDWDFSNDGWSQTENSNIDKVLGTYKYAFAKMQYLDSIISTNIANNPHIGYGKYDDGNTFIEHMKLPFKHVIDKKLLKNYSHEQLAKQYKFWEDTDDIDKDFRVTDKIQVMNSVNNGNETDYVRYEYDNTTNSLVKVFTHKDDKDKVTKRWYINTKVLTISYIKTKKDMNNQDVIDINPLFSNYFKHIIMPYVMQVIPSTTILKLKDFM